MADATASAALAGAGIGITACWIFTRRAGFPPTKLTISLIPDNQAELADGLTRAALLTISLLPDSQGEPRR